MTQIQSRNSAASPVIGVMLMLVVTIIIAAVVSGYAGGLAGGTGKAPQIALGAKVYNTTSITLIHQGGDPLAWENIEFRTFIPSGTFRDMTQVVNLSAGTYIPTDVPIIENSGDDAVYAPPFRPGDEAVFPWDACFAENTTAPDTYIAPIQGQQVVLQLFDKVSNKMIVEKTITNL